MHGCHEACSHNTNNGSGHTRVADIATDHNYAELHWRRAGRMCTVWCKCIGCENCAVVESSAAQAEVPDAQEMAADDLAALEKEVEEELADEEEVEGEDSEDDTDSEVEDSECCAWEGTL